MRLRNFDTSIGHCNRTGCILVSFHDHVIKTDVASDNYAGSNVLITRNGISNYIYMQIFSVKQAFTLACNKSLGQVFE